MKKEGKYYECIGCIKNFIPLQLELKVFITNQSNFYNEMINVLVDKKNLLITFSGLTKIEAQLGGY